MGTGERKNTIWYYYNVVVVVRSSMLCGASVATEFGGVCWTYKQMRNTTNQTTTRAIPTTVILPLE